LVDGRDADDPACDILEFRARNAIDGARAHREAHERRWHIELLEAARHRVFAADGADAQVELRHQGTQHCTGRLAPALGHIVQLLEVLLQAQVHRGSLEAGGHELGDAFNDRQVGAAELVLFHQVGVEAPGHAACRGGLADDGELRHERLVRGELAPAAEREHHRSRADGGVEALGKAAVAGHVQVGDERGELLFERAALPAGVILLAFQDMHVHMLGRAVAGEEFAAQVDDGVAVPHHLHAAGIGDLRDGCGLEVLLRGKRDERIDVLGGQRHRHALLAFRDGKLGAIKAIVLLGNAVEVDPQAVGQLADAHRNAAGAEVVAALDHAAGGATAEESLNLALNRRIAFLHLGAAFLDARGGMLLRAARCAADAVTAGTAAEQHDDIAGSRLFATHMIGGRRAQHRADFHALGHVTGMVKLADLRGCQANLVAVAGIAARRRRDDLALRQLAGQRVGDGDGRIAGACHAHGLIYITAAGKRVADGAAHAGGRAAERLDLGGMIVRLVLEQEQPILVGSVHVDLHLHGAGVHLFRFVEVFHLAVRLQVFRADGAHVHQADGLPVAAKLLTDGQVLVECLLHDLVVDFDVVEYGAERGMTAVVRPIRVDDFDFGNRGIALLADEILLAELQVGKIHRKAAVLQEGGEAGFVKVDEALEYLDRRRLGIFGLERLDFVE